MDDEKKNDDDPVDGVDGNDVIYDSSILQIQQAESLVVHRSSSGDNNNNNNNRIMDVELDDVQGIDDLHLQALKEYYAICQEHHQHYRSLLLEYQSKVLDLEEVVELSQIKLDSAREKIQRYEHLQRSKKMELIKNQISKVRAEFDLVKDPRQDQEQQQQVQEVEKQDVEEGKGAEIKIETTPSKDDEGDVDNAEQAEKVEVEAAAVAAATLSPAEASNASQPRVIRVKDGVEDLFDHNTDIEQQSSLRSEDTLYRVVGSTLSKEDVEVVMKRDKDKQEEDAPAESADAEPAQQEHQQQQQQENESALVKELKLPSLKPEDAQEAAKVSIADETPRARGGSVEAEGRGEKQEQEQKQEEFFQKEDIVDSPPEVKRQVITLEEEKLTNVVIGRTVSKGDIEPMTTNHSLSSTPSRNKVPASSTPPAMKAASTTPSTRQSKLPKPTPPKSTSSSSDVGVRSSAGTTSAFLKRLQQSRARSASPMRPSEERQHHHHHGAVSNDNTPTGARVDGGKRTTVRVQNPKSQSHPTPQKPRGRAASEDSFGGRRITRGQSPKTQMYTTPQKAKRATSEELILSSSPSAASTNVSIPGTPSSASKNGGVDANGNMIVMEQTTISVWLRVLSKSSQFHRIRQYIPKSQRAIDDTDVGRKSAVWSFVNGCIMHHDIHEQLYQKFHKSANALAVTRYFNTSRCPPPVNKVTQAKWHSIWEFCKICAGDIVCLMLPHPDPHESLVAFGVVQDHKVVFEKQSNLRIDWDKKKKQQPQQQQQAATNAGPASAGSLSSSALDKIDFPTAKSIGEYVLLRKIRWYRIAKTRDLPGQTHGTKKDYVDWLTENHPKSISNVTGRGARDFLQSEEFFDCCCSTNNIPHLLHLHEPGEEEVQYIPPISPRLLSTAASLTTAPSPIHQQQKGNNNGFQVVSESAELV